MTFYSAVHLQQDPIDSSYSDSDSIINGRFDLINFSRVSVGKFHFKEYLTHGDGLDFVRVNAIFKELNKELYIDLKEHPSLLSRIKPSSPEGNAKQINDLIMVIPGIDIKIVEDNLIFMHLGIEDETDQKIALSSEFEDILLLANLFNKIFLGETIELKIKNYRLKKSNLEGKDNSISILDKIFKIGLLIKIFRKEVSLSQIPSYLRCNEFSIAERAKDYLGASLVEAACNNFDFLVQIILLEDKYINSEYLSSAICDACREGHESIVRILLSDRRSVPENGLGTAFSRAVMNGHESIVKFIFSKELKIPQKYLEDALFNSINKNLQESLIKLVLSKCKNLSQESLDINIKRATERNNKSIVSILENMQVFINLGIKDEIDQKIAFSSKYEDILQMPNLFNKIFLGETVEQKIENYRLKKSNLEGKDNSISILDKIFKIGLSIKIFENEVLLSQIPTHLICNEFFIIKESKTFLESAFFKAVDKNSDFLVQFFLLKGRCINEDCLKLSIIDACRKGYESIVRIILSDYRVVSKNMLGDAFFRSVQNNHQSIVKFIISNNFHINKEDLERSIFIAIKKDIDISLIKLILPKIEHLSQDFLKSIIKRAIQKNNPDILKYLLPKGVDLSLESRSNLILDIVHFVSPDILRILLSQGPVCSDIIYSAISLAARNDNRLAVIRLLQIAQVEAFILDQRGMPILLEDVKVNPKKYLEKFSELKKFPKKFYLLNSTITYDLGGVSKQVVSTLFFNLCEKYSYFWSAEKLLISQKDEITIDDLKFYSDLSKVVSLIYEKNKDRSDKLLIGPVFNPEFFDILRIYKQSVEHKKIENIFLRLKVIEPFYNPLYEYYVNPNPESKKNYKEFLIALGNEEELINDSFIASEMEKQITKIVEPLKAFIDGSSEFLKQKIFDESLAKIALFEIQGHQITKDAVIKSFRFIIPSTNQFGYGSQSIIKAEEFTSITVNNSYLKCLKFLIDKINSADEEWLINFILVTTGRRSLTPNITIIIQPSSRGNVIEAHTCSSSLGIPRYLLDDINLEQTFLYFLNNMVENSLEYSIA